MSIGRPTYRRGSKKTSDIKVGVLNGRPTLQVNWGGRIYGAPLSLVGAGSAPANEEFSNIRVGGVAIFDGGGSVCKITGEGLEVESGNIDVDGSINLTTGNKLKINGVDVLTADSSTRNYILGVSNSNAGTGNISIGTEAGENLVSGCSSNISIGYQALRSGNHADCDANIAIGSEAGKGITSGSANICIGITAGLTPNLTTGSNDIYIGTGNHPSASDVTFETVIGTALTGKGAYTCLIGCNNGLYTTGSLFVPEKASATADVAGYGQLWVKNDGDGILMFTDDDGTDYTVDVTAV